MLKNSNFIIPNWPAPPNVKALQTNRNGGFSQAEYASLNFGGHVGDNPLHVAKNRQLLSQMLPSEPVWLNQTHGIHIVDAASAENIPDADASFSTQKNVVCVVMTADCLPVLLCDKAGTIVVAVHAGWRGLCDGALEAAVNKIIGHAACRAAQIMPSDLMAWLGPAIGHHAFEVGAEVRAQFVAQDAKAEKAFKPHGDKYLGSLVLLAIQRLKNCGVSEISRGQDEIYCTFKNKERFFSYRRDGVTGRMATCIWLE